MVNSIKNIVSQNRAGEHSGIFSVCSANEFVIEASVQFAKRNNSLLLVEATSNQVDQFGGYTGMKPRDFADYVKSIAEKNNFDSGKLVLGGDHLGPNRWQTENEESAMLKAKEQVKQYVEAGFTKIHLDTSMSLGGEKTRENGLLDAETVANRSVELCKVAENASQNIGTKPVYIIGTDVPVPGGAKETEDDIRITSATELEETIEITREKFLNNGLESAWERVVAVVVQPGVEFSDSKVFEYNHNKAIDLVNTISTVEGIAFEAHSTDYQNGNALRQMVSDNFAILKVGPWLTFALREALLGLELVEKELLPEIERSGLRITIENQLDTFPEYWIQHYHGSEREKRISRIYSFSDRIRYYWTNAKVKDSVKKLIRNLESKDIPLTLLSQFLPNQYKAIREGLIENNINYIILNRIEEVLSIYNYAVRETL